MKRVLLILFCALGGCSSTPQPAPTADLQMQQAGRAGQLGLSLDHPGDAARQFRTALRRAELRDDLSAITDYGYDLAVAQLADNRPNAALATARQVSAELARRNSPRVPGLELVTATALYRTASFPEADALAASLEQSSERDVVSQACFLRGLIADDRNDVAGLEAALSCANRAVSGADDANASELSARISLRHGDAAAAETTAARAADLRRELHDYRGMARSLAVAGAAARLAGSTAAAASFYLRAGRSAAAQGDATTARRWLQSAMSFSRDANLRAEAQLALHDIDESRRNDREQAEE